MKTLLLTTCIIFSLLNLSIAQTVPNYVPTNGLLSWYSFNGNGNDESTNTNDATNFGASFVSDRMGSLNAAASFNGFSNYLQVASPSFMFSETGSFTYSIWINKPNADLGVFLMSGTTTGGNFISLVQGQSDVKFGTNQQQSAWTWASTTLTQNVWDHYIATYDNKVMNLYKNGLFQTTATYPYTGAATTTLPLYIGRGVSGNYYDGLLDDIGIWNRVLTQTEILDLYNSCSQLFTTQPDSQSVNMNLNAQFIAISSDTGSAYQWQEDTGSGFVNLSNGGQYSGTTNDTLNISAVTLSQNNNTYRCIISSGTCTDTSASAILTVINTTGINNITNQNHFSVFPNPASTELNIQINLNLLGLTYSVYDAMGKVVLNGLLKSEYTSINLSKLSDNLYFLQIGNNTKQITKIAKQ